MLILPFKQGLIYIMTCPTCPTTRPRLYQNGQANGLAGRTSFRRASSLAGVYPIKDRPCNLIEDQA
jgi:hypothetical protein